MRGGGPARERASQAAPVAWIAAYDERGACAHDFKWTDGGDAIVTGVCRVGRQMWCAGLQERALMRFDLPG